MSLSLPVTLAVLSAAILHAVWNAITHGIRDQGVAFALLGLGGFAAAMPVAVLAPMPRAACWPYLLGSVAIHVGYNLLLMRAYRLGDFGQVYPLARGTSPLVVTVLALIFVGERPGLPQLAGVLVVSAGLGLLASGWHGAGPRRAAGAGTAAGVAGDRGGDRRAALIAAFGTGLTIAAYTTVDGVGVRASASPAGYIGWMIMLESLGVPLILLIRRRDVVRHLPARVLAAGLTAGALSLVAYGLVLWAQTRGTLAPIAALRETSVIFGAIIASVVFREPFGRARIASAVVVAAGIVLLEALQSTGQRTYTVPGGARHPGWWPGHRASSHRGQASTGTLGG